MVSVADIHKRIKNGESVREIVQDTFAKIDTHKKYNAVISLAKDRALQRADYIEAKLRQGQQAGRLAGVPFLAKDAFLTYNTTSAAGSNILQGFNAPFQATAIERLEAEGAILVGKTNQDAFGHGGSTENSDYGPALHPLSAKHVPGGSSGGSAAAVALGIVPFALGTDTGGSTRQPASFCGVVGLKPTYGAISRYGVVAMASSTDTVGTLASNANDAALVFDVMAGQDLHDSTTLPHRSKSFLPSKNTITGSLKIGIIKEFMAESVQKEVRQATLRQAESLKQLGHTVSEVSLPTLEASLAAYYIIVPAEISSNLSRYDGVRFGASAKQAASLQELYEHTRAIFNAENKRRILIGTYVLRSGYIDEYYRKAQTVRTKIINEFTKAFANYDVLIGPVAATTAFKLGANTADPLQMYLADVMTVGVSLAGLPAISVPAGTDANNLPIGMQIIGPQSGDGQLLALAHQLEEVNNG